MKSFDYFIREISEVFDKGRSKILIIISLTIISITLYPFFGDYYSNQINTLDKQLSLLEKINNSKLKCDEDSLIIDKVDKILKETVKNPVNINEAWCNYFQEAEDCSFSDNVIRFLSSSFIGIIMNFFFYITYRKKTEKLFKHKLITLDFIGIICLWLFSGTLGLLFPKYDHFYLNYLFIPACIMLVFMLFFKVLNNSEGCNKDKLENNKTIKNGK